MKSPRKNDPQWLTSALLDLGVKEVAGPRHNKRVMRYFKAVYRLDIKDDATPWCAAFAGYHLTMAGIPVPRRELALLARSYLNVGNAVTRPRRGDLAVFRRGRSKVTGHVGFYLARDKHGIWILGGNQGDQVSIKRYPHAKLLGFRRPNAPRLIKQAKPLQKALTGSSKFDRCHALTAKWEGGYSNHPDDPGGATNFGVTQNVYNAYRRAKGQGRRAVKHISRDEVRQIYVTRYWHQVRGDDLPVGVDLAVYDFAVNSGTTRAAKLLQRLVGAKADGVIGAGTMAKVRRQDPVRLAADICDHRLKFLKGLKTWRTFGRGWANRVRDVRASAIEWAAEGKSMPAPAPVGIGVGFSLMALINALPWVWIVATIAAAGLVYLAYRNRHKLAHQIDRWAVRLSTKILKQRDLLWPDYSSA